MPSARYLQMPLNLHAWAKAMVIPTSTLPSTQQLLLMGGDERIALDEVSGMNRYGCRPTPDTDLLDFGSSTASVVSETAYQAAEQLREKLIGDSATYSHAQLYARELARMREQLLVLCDIKELAKPDVIFAASGTDLHGIAAHLAHAASTRPVMAIMVNEAETGSGVHAALINSRFATEVSTVALRKDDGTARPIEQIDADFEHIARRAVADGFHVLLIQTDLSKTGMIAPSYTCTANLQQALDKQIDILVDACQFRMSTSTLRTCLARGYNIALTGSKFISGPSFSGALLIPAETANRLRELPFPQELAHRTALAEWPSGWTIPVETSAHSNIGLLLRWEAALCELRAFRALADEDITRFVSAFAAAMQQRMENDPMLVAVDVPTLKRDALMNVTNWDNLPTIFSFQVLHQSPNCARLLDNAEMQAIYHQLRTTEPRCQLGQPVQYGLGKKALRLCLSSRLIVQALQDGDRSSKHIIEQANLILDRVTDLVKSEILEHSETDLT